MTADSTLAATIADVDKFMVSVAYKYCYGNTFQLVKK